MKIIFTFLSVLLLTILFNNAVNAQGTIAGWDVSTQTDFGTSPLTASTTGSNVSIGSLTRGTGIGNAGTGAARGWGGTGWNVTTSALAISGNKFVTFTVKANSGYKVSLSAINPFDYRRSSTGPPSGLIQYSLDGTTFTDIATVSFPTSTSTGDHVGATDLSVISDLQNVSSSTTITIRIVPYNASSSGGTWYIFDVDASAVNDLVMTGNITATECVLSLTALIQARYNGSVMVPDTVTVELHDESTLALVDQNKELLSASGTGTFTFSNALNSSNYYIVVKHRNSIETWSASVQSFTSYALSYNFTTEATQAYGSNLILKGSKYCIYSGDVNQDGWVSGDDFTGVDNDNFAFTYHIVNDLNGDGVVNGDDYTCIDNNNSNFVSKNVPTPPSVLSLTGVLTSFSQTSATPSAEQTYNISGTGLTTNVTVVPPTGFEISKTISTGFVNSTGSLVYTAADVMAGKTIYVRMNAGSAGSYSGSITHTSAGSQFTPVTQSVSGTYLIISNNVNLTMGNPSSATTDINNPHNYLLDKPQFCASYDRDKGIPNWTSWQLNSTWCNGPGVRKDNYIADATLPSGWHQVGGSDYSGSGFSRGHMCPSADRINTQADNDALFVMTNMVPQNQDNNAGAWEGLENYERTLANAGNVEYIISGGYGAGGTGTNGTFTTISNGYVTVPAKLWKVIIVLPAGTNDISRVTVSTRTIAIIIPNDGTPNNRSTWGNYRVSVDSVEALTGYDFFSNISTSIQVVIEANVDSGPTQ